MTAIEAPRLFAEITRREADARAERERALAEALRRFERPRQPIAPQSWEYALTGIAVLLWAGTILMVLRGLLASLP